MSDKKNNEGISRRRFLQYMGLFAGAAAVGACATKSEEKTPEQPTGSMTMRVNPNSGDSVSLLGYGCMRWPSVGLINGTDDTTIDQEAVNRLVDAALEAGVNYFDTSPAYCQGQSEAVTGIALSRHPRDSYFIATKLSNFAPQTWPREKSIEMFENSLKYLQTDYVDYLLLHAIGGGGMDTFNKRYVDNGILQWLVEQKEAGRIRNLGFSYHGDVEVFDTMLQMMDRGEIHWDFVQIQLNYVDWKHAKEVNERNTDAEYLYGELDRRGIPVVIMEPLLGGRLAKVPEHVEKMMKERRPDNSVASWAFRSAGTHPRVLTVLSGMTYMEHLTDNLATFSSLDPITDDEAAFLERCAKEILSYDSIPCNTCNYCMPCPYGIDIPGVFNHYNRCLNEGNVPRDKADPEYAKARRAFMFGYDNSVPRLRQAVRCVNCGTCNPHCPQNIDIPAKLREINLFVENLRSEAK